MKYAAVLLIFILSACETTKKSSQTRIDNNSLITDGKLFAVAYQQLAAEYRALCYQAYNIAHLRLEQQLQQPHDHPLAIITDIDETLLSNSPSTVQKSLSGKDFDSQSWNNWTSKANADTVPGALNFLKYASANGVSIYYITNREEKDRVGTIQNLKKFNFPDADDIHLLPRQSTSSKEIRRQQIM